MLVQLDLRPPKPITFAVRFRHPDYSFRLGVCGSLHGILGHSRFILSQAGSQRKGQNNNPSKLFHETSKSSFDAKQFTLALNKTLRLGCDYLENTSRQDRQDRAARQSRSECDIGFRQEIARQMLYSEMWPWEVSMMALFQQDVPQILETLSLRSMLTAVFIFAGAWFAIRWNSKGFEFLSARSVRGRFLFKRVQPVIGMLIWFSATYLALLTLAPSRETLIVLIASVALAIGLGAQDLVKNIVGGLVVMIDRPYQPGDRVRIGDAYGEINQIGLRSTTLTTPNDTQVTIPNSEVLTGAIYNASSGMPDCHVVTDIIVPHNADPEVLIGLGYEAAYSSPYLFVEKPVSVLILDRFDQAPYAILRVKNYVFDHRVESRMQSDITVRVKSELLRLGVLESLPLEGDKSPCGN
jgi:small-conductance mechanosensitive channel